MKRKTVIGTLVFTLLIILASITGQAYAYCGRCEPSPCCQRVCPLPCYQRCCFHVNWGYNYRGSGEEEEFEWVPDPWDP